ncbi:MAG: DUF4922 domain-containing protein [Prevotellaceae bacterium]|jgi:ATP adenylyltransferase/5',5'''-P-1,P-4-tetraphosphate phosphorylase II|nr:DUF4922 domain-containing protein [Prevotellaceae bacterium]
MNIEELFKQQLAAWPQAHDNYAALSAVRTKEMMVGDVRYKVQFNPARITSSAAKTDAKSIRERPCFLCAKNRPEVQTAIPFDGGRYEILVNPFPIFPRHLTIPAADHTLQLINGRMGDMLALAKELAGYTLFYNGPKCGASAPDHFHFQAGSRGFMPIEETWQSYIHTTRMLPFGSFHTLCDAPRNTYVIETTNAGEGVQLFEQLYDSLPRVDGEAEPRMNILCWYEMAKWVLCIFARAKHRPSCYYAEGAARLLSSPAAVDLGGVFILPREEDFEKIDPERMRQILDEVCYSTPLKDTEKRP